MATSDERRLAWSVSECLSSPLSAQQSQQSDTSPSVLRSAFSESHGATDPPTQSFETMQPSRHTHKQPQSERTVTEDVSHLFHPLPFPLLHLPPLRTLRCSRC